ncbi:hypothetical protein JZ751_026653 [Albula glossodonta]|uniref:Uncharacterized protein n=1 Tax=Albula glossodonta TaxID=121402 RepID=A0A8T2PDL3_9TELE|nr:hypothetical protein JZ751_026653 [Albula glossodonta]
MCNVLAGEGYGWVWAEGPAPYMEVYAQRGLRDRALERAQHSPIALLHFFHSSLIHSGGSLSGKAAGVQLFIPTLHPECV